MTRIVTTSYRYKRPPQKRRVVALEGPAIVRKVKAAKGVHTADTPKSGQAPPPPANDDRKPAIVTTTSRSKRGLIFRRCGAGRSERTWVAETMQQPASAIVTARRPGARRVPI